MQLATAVSLKGQWSVPHVLSNQETCNSSKKQLWTKVKASLLLG